MSARHAAATLGLSVAALVVIAGSAAAMPARDGNAPLTHFSGSFRLIEAGEPPTDWDYVAPDQQAAMTLGGGVRIEMRWGGRCTDPATGQLRVARLGHHVTCG